MNTARRLQSGFTLVEVVIAMLVAAVVVTSVFSVSLTARKASAFSDRKIAANYAAKRLSDMLKNYVAADISTPGNGPNGNWCLPGTVCTGCAAAPAGCALTSCYALDMTSGCTINATAATSGSTTLIPAAFTAAPYNMTMTYTVKDENGSTGLGSLSTARPTVSITVNWTEP